MKIRNKNINSLLSFAFLILMLTTIIFGSLFLNLNFQKTSKNTDKEIIIRNNNGISNQDWERMWGAANYERAYATAVDSTGNIYITGSTNSFGEGSHDIFLIKYSSSGTKLWNTTWGGSESDSGRAISLDSLDNVYLTGPTSSFGEGDDDVFLIKFSSSGSVLWNKTWGYSNDDEGRGITIDSLDNIYITGYTKNITTLDYDTCLIKYDNSGDQIWNRTWGGSEGDYGFGIAKDSLTSIYITGNTYSYEASGSEAFLIKYSPLGSIIWNKTWGGSGNEFGKSLSTNLVGNIYMTGYTDSYGINGYDMFLIKYNNSGAKIWNTTWGGSFTDYGNGIAMDSSENLYIIGETDSFGAGGDDAFLVKYDSSGTKIWNITWGGLFNDYGRGIDSDLTDNIYIVGDTSSFGLSGSDTFLIKYLAESEEQQPVPSFLMISVFIGIMILVVFLKTKHKKFLKFF